MWVLLAVSLQSTYQGDLIITLCHPRNSHLIRCPAIRNIDISCVKSPLNSTDVSNLGNTLTRYILVVCSVVLNHLHSYICSYRKSILTSTFGIIILLSNSCVTTESQNFAGYCGHYIHTLYLGKCSTFIAVNTSSVLTIIAIHCEKPIELQTLLHVKYH